jgi:hypothetical protein
MTSASSPTIDLSEDNEVTALTRWDVEARKTARSRPQRRRRRRRRTGPLSRSSSLLGVGGIIDRVGALPSSAMADAAAAAAAQQQQFFSRYESNCPKKCRRPRLPCERTRVRRRRGHVDARQPRWRRRGGRSRRLRANVRAFDADVAGGTTGRRRRHASQSHTGRHVSAASVAVGQAAAARRRRRRPVEGRESSLDFTDRLMRLCVDAFGPNGLPRLELAEASGATFSATSYAGRGGGGGQQGQ